MERGYVKLWRKTLDTEIFCDPMLFRLWSWCLLKTTYVVRSFPLKVGRGTITIKLQEGQFIFGRNKAADELQEPASTVWKRMKKLELKGMIEMNSNKQYTIITICNWCEYQQEETEKEQPRDNQGTTKEQPRDNQGTTKEQPRNTYKKVKKVKKRNKDIGVRSQIIKMKPDFFSLDQWGELYKHRTAKKATQSVRAYTMLIKEFGIAVSRGYTAENILDAISGGGGWKGFKADWMNNIKNGSDGLKLYCDTCINFCSSGSPDKCNQRGNKEACDEHTKNTTA